MGGGRRWRFYYTRDAFCRLTLEWLQQYTKQQVSLPRPPTQMFFWLVMHLSPRGKGQNTWQSPTDVCVGGYTPSMIEFEHDILIQEIDLENLEAGI